jgi:uncharacterized damage-inducible protein DinB
MKITALASSVLLGATVLRAQAPTTTSTGVVLRPQPAATVSGFKSDLLAQYDDAAKKIQDLAAAFPAEKYSWRPAAGVRSVSEVFVHVAAGNTLLPTFLGLPRPAGIDRDAEKKITDKSQVIDVLKTSIAHARSAIEHANEAALDRKVKFFGEEVTQRWILLQMATHIHEHLGQAIAYARMNGVAPPWSEGH